jgi:hypothetical protein
MDTLAATASDDFSHLSQRDCVHGTLEAGNSQIAMPETMGRSGTLPWATACGASEDPGIK